MLDGWYLVEKCLKSDIRRENVGRVALGRELFEEWHKVEKCWKCGIGKNSHSDDNSEAFKKNVVVFQKMYLHNIFLPNPNLTTFLYHMTSSRHFAT